MVFLPEIGREKGWWALAWFVLASLNTTTRNCRDTDRHLPYPPPSTGLLRLLHYPRFLLNVSDDDVLFGLQA